MSAVLDIRRPRQPRRRCRRALSPNQRAWARFQRNRLGYCVAVDLRRAARASARSPSCSANDTPLVARYDGQWFFPVLANPPETRFGGDFATPTDWKDPFIRAQFAKPGNWALYTLNAHSADLARTTSRRRPTRRRRARNNWLGTDDTGRDLLARLLYGFRISVCSASR